MTTDEAIQRRFNFRAHRRNLPFYPRHGTREDLAAFLGEMGFAEGVEVGTYLGEFAELLCKCNPKLHLTCVDPYAAYMGRTQEREDGFYAAAVQRLKGRNVTFLRKPSLDGALSFKDKSLDFVYIDGNHLFDEAIRDMIAWCPKVRSGGIVGVHDFSIGEQGADVYTAVEAYTRAHHIDPWYVTRELAATAFWVQR